MRERPTMNDAMRLPASPPFDPEAIPAQAVVARGGGALRLTWPDGTSAALSAERLRLACRCAWCTRDRAQDRFPARFEGVAVARVDQIGGYAVNIAFTDGHARGIFPWVYLRRLADEAQGDAPSMATAATRAA
jgi:prepilin-type processing-associated H-X9-DG protein